MRPRPSLLIFFAFVFLILPLFLPSALVLAQATQVQGHTASSGLVPCGAVPGSNYLVATECNLCDLTALIQRIINYLIVLAMPISAALFAWAGIILFTAGDDPGKRSQAKSIFKNVGIGLLIALSGFLVIQTLLNALVKGSDMFSGGFSFSFSCAEDPTGTGLRPRAGNITSLFTGLTGGGTLVPAPAAPTVPTPTGGTAGGREVVPSLGTAPLGETTARNAILLESGGQITINHDCADGQTGCLTQMGGVKGDVISAAEAVQKDCAYANAGSCSMVITGGSESHSNGASDPHSRGDAVDIRTSQQVDAQMRTYIGLTSNPTPSISGDGYTATINGQSTRIYFEGTHWHVEARR